MILYNKTFFKNERVWRDIKTEKPQEQDWDGTLAAKLNKPLPHNNRKARVKHKEAMQGCYMEYMLVYVCC